MKSTEQPRRYARPRTSLLDSGLARPAAALAGLLTVAAFAAIGCDTTARVSFPNRTFNEVHSSGMIAPAGMCGELGGSNNTAKLRFAMVDDDGAPIRPKSKGGQPLDTGPVNITPESIEATNGAMFDSPDLQCNMTHGSQEGGETSWRRAAGYYDGSSCEMGFMCTTALAEAADASAQRCNTSTGYSVENVAHTADVDQDQMFGVLMENGGSLEGYAAGIRSSTFYYDSDGDLEADKNVRDDPEFEITELATDRSSARGSALDILRSNWEDAWEVAAANNNATQFGLWTFSGSTTPTSVVSESPVGGEDTVWIGAGEPQNAGEVVSAYRNQDVNQEGHGNVLESIDALIEDHYTGSEHEGADKTLVVFVDGPPELHPDETGVDAGAVAQKAQDANVRLFFVHLDPSIGLKNDEGDVPPENILDDPRYYNRQQVPEGSDGSCSSDSDCAPHETCREVRGYTSAGIGEDVTGANGTHSEGTFCMPERRPDGRTGPLEIYGQIACATEGGYQYIKSTNELSQAMGWLPYTMDGLWEVDVTVDALPRPAYSTGEPIRLQGAFEVTAGNTTRTIDLSQVGGSPDGQVDGSGDVRSTIFTRDPESQ